MAQPKLGELVTQFNKMISKEDVLEDAEKILRIRQVNVGEYFSGVVYVVKTTTRRNKDGERFDLTFHCIDGSGTRFLLKMFGTDDIKIEKEIILVKQGQAVLSNWQANVVYYNANAIVRYNQIHIPISEFVREIDNITSFTDKFDRYLTQITDTKIQELLLDIGKTMNIKEILRSSQYSQTVGTSIGSPLEIYVNMMNIYNVMNKVTTREDQKRYHLYNVVTLLYVMATVLTNDSDFISPENKEAMEISTMNNPLVKPIILSPSLDNRDKSIILSIIQEGMVNYKNDRLFKPNNTLAIEFFRNLLTVESKVLMNEMCRGVTTNKLYDGTFIV